MPNDRQGPAQLRDLLDRHLNNQTRPSGEPRVLEAGGGATTRIAPPNAHITTIDICDRQLARNSYAHEKIHADLHDVDLSAHRFDVVICWNVLEHLRDPACVVDRLSRAVSDHGVIVVASPNPLSLPGLVTKFTPHRVHDFFHTKLMRTTEAGGSGFRPFRTYIRLAMRADALKKQLAERGFEIVHCAKYESSRGKRLRSRSPWAGRAYKAALLLCRITTLGSWRAERSDYVLIGVRRAHPAPAKTAAAPHPVPAAST